MKRYGDVIRHLNLMINPLDQLFIRKKGKGFPPLFIIGVPRSGTTLVYQIVVSQFQVSYLPRMMNYTFGLLNCNYLIVRKFLDRHKKNIGFKSSYGKIEGLFSPSEHINFWLLWISIMKYATHSISNQNLSVLERLKLNKMKNNLDSLSMIANKPIVFKNLYLSLMIDILEEFVPDSLYLLVERDINQTIYSLYKARMMQKNPNEWWSVKPAMFQQWTQLPILHQVVNQAIEIDKQIKAKFDSIESKRKRIVNYEKLCSNPQNIIEYLSEWLSGFGYKRIDNADKPEIRINLQKRPVEIDTMKIIDDLKRQ